MHHIQLLFSLLPLFVLLSATPSPEPSEFSACSSTTISCGGGWTISYPFRLPGMPAGCGHPAFEVRCVRNQSILLLSISGTDYAVSNIRYDIKFVGVSNLAFIRDTCPLTYSNTTVDASLFTYADNGMNMTAFLNCSPAAHAHALRDIPCLSNPTGNQSYYSLPTDGAPPPADLFDFLGVLQDGCGLNWVVGGGWCGGCEDSGGVCGSDPGAPGAPACFCGDGTMTNGTCTGKSNSHVAIIGIAIGGVVGALILGCCLLLLYNRRKKQRQSSLSNLLSRSNSSKISSKKDPELGETTYHTHIFSYDELEEATNGFNASRELGDGGFGTVYKGKLHDGRTVAVKRLYEHNYRRLEQFKNEVEILSSLRHKNLVTLYGCTSRHSRELLLVYEFIPNGTVADHLHGPLTSKEALPWSVRLSIAIETADALAYLHAVEPQIIHRDVKTTNILLDDGFHVKVADFGLSRLFPLDVTHVSTAPQGTPGYVDPEYHQCYQLTDKSDVYSFGVVLVELISSKPAVDISRHRHEINLSNMAITKIQNGQIDQLVDPELGYQSYEEIKRAINQVAELAFRCLQPDRELRPSIKEVLEGLKSIAGARYGAEKEAEVAEVQVKEEARLLKNVLPFSPDSVTERWSSRTTTPNTSS